MNSKALKIIGAVSGIGLGASLYLKWNRRRKDRLAADLLRELSKLIKPSTAGLLSEGAFDIHYKEEVLKKATGRVLTLKAETASGYAGQIHRAWKGWWQGGDDENKVYAVFRKLKDKVQVSQVARAYQESFRVNLIDKLHDRLKEREIKTVLSIVKKLPAYRTV